jgi:2-polyprenyl-3-methyl-5-hydroxy-6-metoxy-1,4-benzoquinol methylase
LSDIQAKWDAIYQEKTESGSAATVLTENQHLLPPTGTALELACGLGANALFLAEMGLDVAAWDISTVAIERLRSRALECNLSLQADSVDIQQFPPMAESFDVIVVSHFLDRTLCPAISAALKPGGLLFYQTFCKTKVSKEGPNNPDFLLNDNELLTLFSELAVRVYREDTVLGNLLQGWRNQAMLVAQKMF